MRKKKALLNSAKLHKGTVSAGKGSYNSICSRRLMAYIIFKMQKNINRRDQLKRKYSSLLQSRHVGLYSHTTKSVNPFYAKPSTKKTIQYVEGLKSLLPNEFLTMATESRLSEVRCHKFVAADLVHPSPHSPSAAFDATFPFLEDSPISICWK